YYFHMNNRIPKINLGIDLGTSNSCVSFFDEELGRNIILPDIDTGNNITPSEVYYAKNGTIYVGKIPDDIKIDKTRLITAVKRYIGRQFNDSDVQRDKINLPYKLSAGSDNGVIIDLGDKKVTPVEVSAAILKKLKQNAISGIQKYFGSTETPNFNKITITTPAYFNASQNLATQKAAEIAGFSSVNILDEPVSASLAYGLANTKNSNKNKKTSKKIAIYDLGGGTFDAAIVESDNSDPNLTTFTVKAKQGDNHAGGEDIDIQIANFIKEKCQQQYNFIIADTPKNQSLLKNKAKQAKHDLTNKLITEIYVDDLTDRNGKTLADYDQKHKDATINFTRTQLDQFLKPFIDKTIEKMAKVVKEHAVRNNKYSGFGWWWQNFKYSCKNFINKCCKFFGFSPLFKNIKPPINSLINIDEVILMGGMTRIPYIQHRVGEFFNKTPNINLNPDEGVALGASTNSAKLASCKKAGNILLENITPLSLGIGALNQWSGKRVFSEIIPKGRTIIGSVKQRQQYKIALPATNLMMDIYQSGDVKNEGDLSKCQKIGYIDLNKHINVNKDNKYIGVEFEIDGNGTLRVNVQFYRNAKDCSQRRNHVKEVKHVLNSFAAAHATNEHDNHNISATQTMHIKDTDNIPSRQSGEYWQGKISSLPSESTEISKANKI
ncbi:MAG: Hsp70 family protein, partial [Pseudomonadota bacterium]